MSVARAPTTGGMNDAGAIRAGTIRAGRWCAVGAASTTGAAAAAVVTLAAPGRLPLVAVLVGALIWGAGGSVAVALMPEVTERPSDPDESDTRIGTVADSGTRADTGPVARIGTVMQLGGVPDDVARITSAAAAASGPVVLVVPTGREAPELLDPAVVVHRAGRSRDGDTAIDATGVGGEEADVLAALGDDCDVVLFGSARAFPGSGRDDAARQLTTGASWVVGTTDLLNEDRFGPMRGDQIDARLRRRSTAVGLWCWEPDATMVRTSVLRTHPMPTDRPLGSWLRARAAEGLVGATVDAPLARRAAAVAADGYWPDTTARQRAAAADLADAATSSSLGLRARLIATGLLMRALAGWSVVLWLAALVLLAGGSPVRRSDGALAALVATAVVLRWLAPRLAAGLRPSPITDVVAAMYALPGSLAATTSACSRRVRPARRAVPTRPLVWMALAATIAAGGVVLTARPGDGVARVAAGLAAALLVLLWVFTVRSLIERSWRRVGFRLPLDLSGIVASGPDDCRPSTVECRVIDGSPAGFALRGPITGLVRGDEVTVWIPRAREIDLVLDGTVAARRHRRRGTELLGVELRRVEPGSAAWAAVLLDASFGPSSTPVAPVDERADRGRWGRLADRLTMGLVVGASIAVMITLALVLAGVRPLIIRSGSMEPTYSVGDVVLVASEQAGDLRPGQVVTRFNAPEAADSLTHRVQDVSVDDATVRVQTRGDANDTGEIWSAPADEQVGVVVASVPLIGFLLTSVRTSTTWAVLVGIGVLGVIAVLFRPRRRQRPGDSPDAGTGAVPVDQTLNLHDEVPTGTATTTIGDRP